MLGMLVGDVKMTEILFNFFIYTTLILNGSAIGLGLSLLIDKEKLKWKTKKLDFVKIAIVWQRPKMVMSIFVENVEKIEEEMLRRI